MRWPVTQLLPSASNAATAATHIVGAPRPAHGGQAADMGVELRVVAHHAATEISLYGAGCNGVHGDAACAKLLGQISASSPQLPPFITA